MNNSAADQPKYAITEIERRWLVDPSTLGSLEDRPYSDIEDRYISHTQLRLRKITNAQGSVAFKLCKKYGKANALTEPITNLYLSETEYLLLAQQLKGDVVCKRRYLFAGGAIDVYENASTVLFEVEFKSESDARGYEPPAFVLHEITNNAAYSGAALAAK